MVDVVHKGEKVKTQVLKYSRHDRLQRTIGSKIFLAMILPPLELGLNIWSRLARPSLFAKRNQKNWSGAPQRHLILPMPPKSKESPEPPPRCEPRGIGAHLFKKYTACCRPTGRGTPDSNHIQSFTERRYSLTSHVTRTERMIYSHQMPPPFNKEFLCNSCYMLFLSW